MSTTQTLLLSAAGALGVVWLLSNMDSKTGLKTTLYTGFGADYRDGYTGGVSNAERIGASPIQQPGVLFT